MKRFPSFIRAVTAVAVALPLALAQDAAPTAKQNQEANLKAYVDLLRSDLKKGKVQVLTEMMELSPDDSAKFWPVYNNYDKALTKIADERLAFIALYARNYGNLTDAQVNQIVNGLLDVEGKRTDLKRQYYVTMSQALTPKQAAKFLQVESQIEKLVDLQIAANLPIVE